MPCAKPSRCQEQQVLAGAGTVPLTPQGASHQPGTVAASNHPSSNASCRMCLFPPLAPAGDVRIHALGTLFPERRGRRFCRQHGSALRRISSSPQSASQRCQSPGSSPAIAPAAPDWSGTTCACCMGSQQMQTTAPCLLSPHLNRKPGPWKASAKFLLCRGTARTCPFMPGKDLDTAASFKQTEVMPRSKLAICFLQDRVSVQGTGKPCRIKPFASGYQLVTRTGGRRKDGI